MWMTLRKEKKGGEVSMLMGTYSHTLDAKWRLIVPSKIREELKEECIITKSFDHCLALYPVNAWNAFSEKINSLPKNASQSVRDLRRFFYANSMAADIDRQGRLLIPENYREYASLQKEVTLIGVEDHVEIWDSGVWNRYSQDLDINDIAADLNDIKLDF